MNRLAEHITQEDVLPLKQQEMDLLYLLRNVYRFGSVEIVMRDGIPVDIVKTVERVRLGNLSTEDIDTLK